MTRRTIPDYTPDGLKRRLAELERQVADLQRVRNPPAAPSVGGVQVEDVTTTSYTVTKADDLTVKRFTNASAVTVTLPAGLPLGQLTHLLFVGAAGGSVQDDGTSVVNGEGSFAQHEEASCLVVASSTWSVLLGTGP